MKRIFSTDYCTSTEQFAGFYQSSYAPAERLYDLNNGMLDLPPHKAYDMSPHGVMRYKNAVAKEWVDIVKGQLKFATGNVIKSIKFMNVDSPRYYNFETDKVIMKVRFDIKCLEQWCFQTKEEKFNEFLHEHFTSRAGFISFIPNNTFVFIREYKQFESYEKLDESAMINAMLEFYLNCQIDFKTDVEDVLMYWVDENILRYCKMVNED